jgi:TolB protein
MRADGSNVIRLTRDAAEDTDPAWSPDGKRIIFSSNRTGRFGIYEMSID